MNTQTSTKTPDPRLQILGRKIGALDRLLVHLLAKRQQMSEEVAMIKIEANDPIYRKVKEDERLAAIRKWAEEEGINPDFAHAALYNIIGESCKIQMIAADEHRISGETEKYNPSPEELKSNLIVLTDAWAPIYDGDYGLAHPATRALRDYENLLIDKAVLAAPDHELLLDLGCATGVVSRRLRQQFDKIQGFDISHKMIEKGWGALADDRTSNIELEVHDIETGIPLKDNSVSMIVMNSGTGSDMFDFEALLREIRRVLKPHGTFVISFYNKEAWIQRTFFPWPLGLTAGVDLDRNCLEVNIGNRRIPIHARAYALEETRDMFERHNMSFTYATYPTIASILPVEMVAPVGQPEISEVIRVLDDSIARGPEPLGAYIIVSGQKG